MKLEVDGTKVKMAREIEGGKEYVEATLPLVAGCQEPIAEWKIPNMRGIMSAKTKPLKVVEPKAVDSGTKLQKFELPPHQRVAKLTEHSVLQGIKPVLNEKKLGYDWASFTGITLDKDHNSERIIEALKAIDEVTECYYISGAFTLFIRIVAKNHEHVRRILYEQIDNIPGIAKTDSIMELGCAFRRNTRL